MKSIKFYLSLIILPVFFSIPHNLFATVVGSNNSVIRSGYVNFPAAENDNTILGFVFMDGGFALQDGTTTCTYDAFFPVKGDVALNGGTLILTEDLMLNDVSTMTSLGTVVGNDHLFSLAPLMNSLGVVGGSGVFSDVELRLQGDVALNASATFNGDSVFEGNGNVLNVDAAANLIVGSNSTLTLKNMMIRGVWGQNIKCTDDTSKLVLDNVRLILDDNFDFSQGAIVFNNNVDILGTHTFNYTSSLTSTISQDAVLSFQSGTRLVIGKSSPSGAQPLEFTDASSILQLENCTLATNSNGMMFTKGKIRLQRDVTVEVNSTSAANGIFIGDGTFANDVFFELFPGSQAIFTKGYVTFDITQINVIKSRSESAKIYRANESVFIIDQNLMASEFTIEEEDGAITIITPGKVVTYEKLMVESSIGAFQVNANQLDFSAFELVGGQSINIVTGFMPFLVNVSSVNNAITGNGSFVGQVTLQDSNALLIAAVSQPMLANIVLNGGTLALDTNLSFANDFQITGSGIVVLGTDKVTFGQNPLTFSDPVTWSGSTGSVVQFNSDVTLTSTWIFSGDCILDCKGLPFDVSQGSILVAPSSKLRLRNVLLNNVNAFSIACVDDTGVIIFDSSTWTQSSDFALTQGALEFYNDVTMQGAAVFAYESSLTSTVHSLSVVTLDPGFTFNYDPASGSKNLLEFDDATAVLNLNGGTLSVPNSGITLLHGSMSVLANSNIISASPTEPFTFGDNDANDDFTIVIFNGISLNFSQGILNYRNVLNSSWTTSNTYSRLVMQDNTTLNLYETLIGGVGNLTFLNNTQLGKASGKDFIGTIVPLGNLVYVTAS